MPSTIDTWPSKDGLQVGFLNINSARDKKDDISNILRNSGNNFHIFCFAESRSSYLMPDSNITMPGYDIIFLDSLAPKATGLLLFSDL